LAIVEWSWGKTLKQTVGNPSGNNICIKQKADKQSKDA